MSYKSRTRIAFIVLLIFTIDFFNVAHEGQQKIAQEYENEIRSFELSIADYQAKEDEYAQALKTIVNKLYEKEVYGIGGQATPKGENIATLYNTIMNTTVDFRNLLENVDNYFDERGEYISNVPSIWPLQFDPNIRITSGFGQRFSPLTGRIRFHEGIDIVSHGLKIPILATADGIVIKNWPAPDGYWRGHPIFGGMIKIQHANGFVTLYGHLSQTIVLKKEKVKQGQIIGYMGNTGISAGRHLHYEVSKDRELQNPIDYLRWD